MKCPECNSIRTIVRDTVRAAVADTHHRKAIIDAVKKENVIIRRRVCLNCHESFYTKETVFPFIPRLLGRPSPR